MTDQAPHHRYGAVRLQIRNLDVIAVRGRGVISRLISLCTGSPYTHVGFALWVGDTLMLAESRELRGHRLVWLSREIQRSECWWFRGPALPRQQDAVDWLRRAMGADYDYRGVARLAWWLPLRRLPALLSAWLPQPRADSSDFTQRFCAALISTVYRIGGHDPWPGRPDAAVVPGDVKDLECLGRLAYLER